MAAPVDGLAHLYISRDLGVNRLSISKDLYKATAINNVKWVEQLVLQGADVTRTIAPYEMPLVHYAANSGRIDCLKALVRTGIDIFGVEDGGGRTVVHYASQGMSGVLALGGRQRMGIKPRAQRAAANPLGVRVRFQALQNATIPPRRFFTQGRYLYSRNQGEPQPLRERRGIARWVEKLALVRRDDTHLGERPGSKRGECIDVLVAHGADVACVSKLGSRTMLHVCAWCNRHITMRHLFHKYRARLDVDARDAFGETPLHMAAHMGALEAMLMLLQCGADVNVFNNRGESPLHIAVWGRHQAATDLLLAWGALPALRIHDPVSDEYGPLPLDYARDIGDDWAISSLSSASVVPSLKALCRRTICRSDLYINSDLSEELLVYLGQM